MPKPIFINRAAKIHLGGKWFLTVEALHFRVGNIVTIVVPKYFITDLASVPQYLQWLVPVTDDHVQASIVHDYLCNLKILSRAAADGLFFDLLTAAGVKGWKRWAMYFAVRIGAFLPWTIKPPAHIVEKAKHEIKLREGHSMCHLIQCKS